MTSSGLHPARDVDFFDVKGDLSRLLPTARFVSRRSIRRCIRGASATIELDGRCRSDMIGQLHPRLQQHYELPQAAGSVRG